MAQNKRTHIELWKLQRIIEFLEPAECKEKRLISLVIGGGVTLNTLRDVLAASPFSSDHEVKKWFERIEGEFSSFPGRKTPPNGIFFYISASSKVEHFIRISSEPFLPFPSSILSSAGKDGVILRVDRHFFIKPLQELISSSTVKVGFVFIDSNGAMILVLKGGKVEVIQRVATFLPRHNKIQMAGAMKTLIQKVGQMASQELVDSEGKPIINYLVMGGTYDFRPEMKPEVMFSAALQSLFVKLVEITSGSEEEIPGALSKCLDKLPPTIRTVEELSVLQEFFSSGAAVHGAKEVVDNAEKKLVERIIIDASKPLIRFELKSPKDQKVVYEEHPRDFFPYSVVSTTPMIEWLIDNQTRLGVNDLQLITNPNTQDGFKFLHTAEGIGAVLRS